jgi:two-component system sensor histidine kinase DesK
MRSIEQTTPGEAGADPSGPGRLFALLWLIWLPAEVPMFVALFQANPPAARLTLTIAGAVLFTGIYVWLALQNADDVAAAARRASRTRTNQWLPVLVMAVLAVAINTANGPAWFGLYIYTGAALGGRLPTRQAIGALAALELVILLGAIATPFPVVLNTAFFTGFAGGSVIVFVWSMATSRELRAEREAMARFAAVTEERLRIARDLHDLLGHSLSLIALKSELARRLVPVAPERAEAEIGDVERVARTALQEVREAVSGYRQPTLASELHGARDVLAAAGVAYTCEADDAVVGALPASVEAVLAWAVREGITNVVRHSRAGACAIRVTREGGEARVEVTDDGADSSAEAAPGGESKVGGNGLRGLAERVAAMGGRFEAGPRAEGGFRLAVAVPVAQGRQREADGMGAGIAPAAEERGAAVREAPVISE